MKRLSILGSTGSIGVNTLHIVNQFPERFEVVSLSAGLNTHLLKQQILQFRPKIVSVLNKELSEALRRKLPNVSVEIVHGVEGLIRVATHQRSTRSSLPSWVRSVSSLPSPPSRPERPLLSPIKNLWSWQERL